jgi:hypothetical protein
MGSAMSTRKTEKNHPEEIAEKAAKGELITDEEHQEMVKAYAEGTGEKLFETVIFGQRQLTTLSMLKGAIVDQFHLWGLADLRQFGQPAISTAIESYRQKYGEESTDLHSWRRKLHREIQDREKHAGVTPAPATLVRNATITKQLLLNWEELDGREILNIDGETYQAIDIAPEYRETLSSWEATYTLDAVQTYVSEYWENDDNSHLQIDDQNIIITDSFDNFCSRARISGKNRELVKQTLFPPKDEVGPLERVQFLAPHPEKPGKQLFIETYFVIRDEVYGETYNPNTDIEGSQITAFRLRIQRRLYEFLAHKDAIKAGHGKNLFGGGYLQIPKVLNSKIERVLDLLQRQSEFEPVYRSVKYNRAGFAQATRYVLNRWITGAQNREQPMEVSWGELNERGYLATHRKDRKQRRRLDMKAMHAICVHLHRDGEAFAGCHNIRHSQHNTLVFEA